MATHSGILAWRIPRMGTWWAATYGIVQSQTQLTWLSSSIEWVLKSAVYPPAPISRIFSLIEFSGSRWAPWPGGGGPRPAFWEGSLFHRCDGTPGWRPQPGLQAPVMAAFPDHPPCTPALTRAHVPLSWDLRTSAAPQLLLRPPTSSVLLPQPPWCVPEADVSPPLPAQAQPRLDSLCTVHVPPWVECRCISYPNPCPSEL